LTGRGGRATLSGVDAARAAHNSARPTKIDMVAFKRSRGAAGGPFRFRVSDSLEVPLRGRMLRLRLMEGGPTMTDLGVGKKLCLQSPSGDERVVTIVGHAVTGGRATQERLDRIRELDVVISNQDAGVGEGLVDIGWVASGPVSSER
jgi:hypothetical protein